MATDAKTQVCSMQITIAGTAYKVTPIRPHPDCKVRRAFRLRKPDGTAYDVASFGRWLECTCASFEWQHRDKGSACKHIRATVALGILDDPAHQCPEPAQTKLGSLPDDDDEGVDDLEDYDPYDDFGALNSRYRNHGR